MKDGVARRLVISGTAGAVAAVVVVFLLVAQQSYLGGSGFASIPLGLVWRAPWWLAAALPLFVGGGVAAGALAPHVGPIPPSIALAAMFVMIVGGTAAIAISLLLPHLWWPSGVVALILLVPIGVAAGAVSIPRSRRR